MEWSVFSSTETLTLLIASLAGIGLAMLWLRAEPVKPIRERLVIWIGRSHDWLIDKVTYPTMLYPLRFLRGLLGCEDCMSPWLALGVAFGLGMGWKALLAFPCAYAIHLLSQRSQP